MLAMWTSNMHKHSVILATLSAGAVRPQGAVPTRTALMQVIPFCKEEWQSQVGSQLAAGDAELEEKEKWGSYPRLREIKEAHKAYYDDIRGEFCQLELQRDGPTDRETLACMRSLLQVDSMDWKIAAYLCVVRATADRGATTLHRRLMDSELEVRAVSHSMAWALCLHAAVSARCPGQHVNSLQMY